MLNIFLQAQGDKGAVSIWLRKILCLSMFNIDMIFLLWSTLGYVSYSGTPTPSTQDTIQALECMKICHSGIFLKVGSLWPLWKTPFCSTHPTEAHHTSAILIQVFQNELRWSKMHKDFIWGNAYVRKNKEELCKAWKAVMLQYVWSQVKEKNRKDWLEASSTA